MNDKCLVKIGILMSFLSFCGCDHRNQELTEAASLKSITLTEAQVKYLSRMVSPSYSVLIESHGQKGLQVQPVPVVINGRMPVVSVIPVYLNEDGTTRSILEDFIDF